MTKIQKTILIILAAVAILLAVGLIVMHKHMGNGAQSETPAPTSTAEIPIVEVTIPVSTETDDPPTGTSTPSATATAVPADYSPATVTLNPDNPASVTPTPEPAYVRMPTSAPMNTPVPTVPKGMAFTLSILGKTINVASDVEADTLDQSPGWLPTSMKPGKEGTCVVYGHRNRNHLLVLKEIEVEDEIDVITPDGKVYTYVVDKTEILESEDSLHIPTTTGKHLILMTCYPFYYTGHAPQKFVVTCTLKAGDKL